MRKLISILVAAAAIVGIVYLTLPPPPARAASQFATIICDNFKPVSSASNVQIVTAGGTNQFIYICSMSFGSIGGSSFSVVEGTGTTCATSTAAVAGGTTAATGYGLAANGNMNVGGGVGAIAKTAVAGDNVCLFISGTGPLAGVVSWTSAPF